MTPPKNGNRKLILIIATIIILPILGWVFNQVVWGGIQENKAKGTVNASEIIRVEKEAETARDSMEVSIVKQLYTLDSNIGKLEVGQTHIRADIAKVEAELIRMRHLLEEIR